MKISLGISLSLSLSLSLWSAIPSQGERAPITFLSEKRGIAFLIRERHLFGRFLQLRAKLLN
ncbi:hypothetical protein RHMOL_Rhmol01G0205000 [Rhododendron molle]|uniref:Uncharacterized protein n=1 Tax=Rhododendron molle TaxID=49168 RepID=A0ACC0Q701_RHOML|nr:hypothetical protein RHMOL_Rhmol01G0205000 [Rhododendron molle]